MRWIFVVLGLMGPLAFLGCHRAGPPLSGDPPVTPPLNVSSADAPTTPSPQSSLVPAARETAPPLATAAELTLVAELPCEAQVFRLKGGTFVACGAKLLRVDDEEQLTSGGALARGLQLDASSFFPKRIVAVAGKWPDAAWGVTSEIVGNGNSVSLRVYRWKTDRWVWTGKSVQLGAPESYVTFPWAGDGFALLAASAFLPTHSLSFGLKPTALPSLTQAMQSKASAEQYPCKQAMIAPEVAVELSPGDVMVFSGQLCGVVEANGTSKEHKRSLGFERLRAGEKTGELSLLPLSGAWPADINWNVRGAAALSQADAFVSADGVDNPKESDAPRRRLSYFAHFNGKEWQRETPPLAFLSQLWAANGAYFATDDDGALWTRRGSTWFLVEMKLNPAAAAQSPYGEKIADIVALNSETVWLMSHEEGSDGGVLSRIFRLKLSPL